MIGNVKAEPMWLVVWHCIDYSLRCGLNIQNSRWLLQQFRIPGDESNTFDELNQSNLESTLLLKKILATSVWLLYKDSFICKHIIRGWQKHLQSKQPYYSIHVTEQFSCTFCKIVSTKIFIHLPIYIVTCQGCRVSEEPPWLRAAMRHRPLTL